MNLGYTVVDVRLSVKCSEELLMFPIKLEDPNPMQFIKHLQQSQFEFMERKLQQLNEVCMHTQKHCWFALGKPWERVSGRAPRAARVCRPGQGQASASS